MHRRLLSALFLMTFALPSQVVEMTPDSRVGEKFRLTVEKSREDPRGNTASVTPVTVTVLESNQDRLALEWVYGRTEIDDPRADNPVVQALAQSLAGFALRLELDPIADGPRLQNETEVVDRLTQAISGLVQNLLASIPEAQRQTVEASLDQMLNPEMILQSALRDPQLYFALAGVSLELGEEVRIPATLPNPLGGPAFESEIVIQLRAIDQEKSEAVVGWVQAFDPESAAAGARGIIEGALPPERLPNQVQLPTAINIQDTSEFVVDLERGWTKRVAYERRIAVGDRQRVDRTVITFESIAEAAP